MMNESEGNMDEEVLAEIIALAEKLMGAKMGGDKPSMISMEVSKAEPMEDEAEEAAMESLVAKKTSEVPSMPEESDDEFELRKNKRIF